MPATTEEVKALVSEISSVREETKTLSHTTDRRTRRLMISTISLVAAVGSLLALVVFAVIPVLDDTKGIAMHTNDLVSGDIARLERQVERLEADVEAATYIITQQALPAIVYLQDRVKSGLGEDVRVVLQAEEPPFTPPVTIEGEG